jgi:hypothetical protein
VRLLGSWPLITLSHISPFAVERTIITFSDVTAQRMVASTSEVRVFGGHSRLGAA